ncbi:MAG: M14 family zinc carboxypeptidase [Candidatus Velamenicoccus archaeovorus]
MARRHHRPAWPSLVVVLALAASLTTAAVPASADLGAPWNGQPITHGLGPTYGEDWCAAVGDEDVPQTPPLADIPYAAIGCTLERFQAEAAANGVPHRMDVSVIGRSAGGRDIYAVVVNDLETPEQVRDFDRWQQLREMELTDPAGAQALLDSFGQDVKMPIAIEANIHGGEREGTDAMMQVLRDLVTLPYGANEDVDRILDHAILIVIPTINPDGRVAGTRSNAAGLDMNRDFLVQSQPEVRAEVALLQQWLPTAGIGMHGYVNPTLVDGLTKPHNPGFEYDLFLGWNQRRLDANEEALADAGYGITRPVNQWCSFGDAPATGHCNEVSIASSGGAVESGTTVTITTRTAHGLSPGDSVTIAGVTVDGYDGTFTVDAVLSPTSFTYTATTRSWPGPRCSSTATRPSRAATSDWPPTRSRGSTPSGSGR